MTEADAPCGCTESMRLSVRVRNMETLRELDTGLIEVLGESADHAHRRLRRRRLEVIELRYERMHTRACADLNDPRFSVWSAIPEERARQEQRRERIRARRIHSHDRLIAAQALRGLSL